MGSKDLRKQVKSLGMKRSFLGGNEIDRYKTPCFWYKIIGEKLGFYSFSKQEVLLELTQWYWNLSMI